MTSRAEGDGGYGWEPEVDAPPAAYPTWSSTGGGGDASARRETDRVVGEDVTRYERDEVVRATRDLGGTLFSTVPRGTQGRVVDARRGVLHDYVTVRFANGYTEEVRADAVERLRTWF